MVDIKPLLSGSKLTGTNILYAFDANVSIAIRDNVRSIFDNIIAPIVNVSFSEVPRNQTNQTIQIGYTMIGGNQYAYTTRGGVVSLNSGYDNTTNNGFRGVAGSSGFAALIHETLHALGLKHPGNYNAGGGGTPGPYLPYFEDNTTNTVMSYNFAGNAPSSLMPYDVLALQQLYGVRTYNQNNTTYRFDSIYGFSDGIRYWGSATSRTKVTIWDSGGVDTLDFSRLPVDSKGYTFNLKPGNIFTADSDNGTSYQAQDDKKPGGRTSESYTIATFGTAIAYNVTIENVTGTSSNDNIYGNDVGNYIIGLGGKDRIIGYGGADRLLGGDGEDIIYGATGNDSINGGTGDDLLYGEEDNDLIYGDAGNDLMTGAVGFDTLYGGQGNDTLYGYTGNDLMYGEENDDFLRGEDGNDTLDGGNGNDTLVGGNDNDVLNGGTGNDTINDAGGNGKDFLGGWSGNDKLDGGINNDSLYGDSGSDTLLGGDGNDILFGHTDNQSVINVLGIDNSIDYLYGGTGNDTLYSGGGNDVLLGEADNDTLYGGNDDDYLNGGTGGDYMHGGNGNDTYIVDNISDRVVEDPLLIDRTGKIIGGGGNDSVQSFLSYTLPNFVENLSLLGSANLNGTGNNLNNVLKGNVGDNILSGLDGNDTLYGSGGKDILDGGRGNDVLYGWAGDDTYIVDSLGDRVMEETLIDPKTLKIIPGGNDTVRSSIDYTLPDNVENLILMGTGNIKSTGNALNNLLLGNSRNNYLYGLAGNDTISGGIGDDSISGGEGNDNLSGDSGDDYLYGEGGNNVLDGGSGNDIMLASDSVDYTLTNTQLIGQGTDTFVNIEKVYLYGNANDNTFDASSLSRQF